MSYYIGIDLGGTNIKAGIVDLEAGKMMASHSTPTLAREGPDAVMPRMAGLIESSLAANGLDKSAIGGVGVTAPGVLDLDKGTTKFLPNLPGTWPNVPLKATIEAKTGLP